MPKLKFLLVFSFLSIFVLVSLVKADPSKLIDHTQLNITPTAEMLTTINSRKIRFDHASVGANTMNGLSRIVIDGDSVNLEDNDRGNPGAAEKVTLWRDAVIARNSGNDPLDITVFKWCFIDADSADVNALKEAIRTIRTNAYPNVNGIKIIIFTIPLTTSPTADMQSKNQIIRQLPNDFTNLWVYDIADVESTAVDGSRCQQSGKQSLCPQYTTDNGHPDQTIAENRVGKGFFIALYQAAAGATTTVSVSPAPKTTSVQNTGSPTPEVTRSMFLPQDDRSLFNSGILDLAIGFVLLLVAGGVGLAAVLLIIRKRKQVGATKPTSDIAPFN